MSSVDFLVGADAVAPGLSRVQQPLLASLRASDRFTVKLVSFSIKRDALLFPFVYGPLPLWLTVRSASLLHITNSWYAHIVPAVRKPAVVTCHDLIQLEDAESGSGALKPHRRFHARATFAGMLKASFIVCDSQAIATKVAGRAPSVSGHLQVIHPGVSEIFRPGFPVPDVLETRGIHPPYVLYVGSEQTRKNLDHLVSSLSSARQHLSIVQFVKVGRPQTEQGRAALLDSLVRENLVDSTVILDDVTDSELKALYQGASVTVLPSLREGFGFPALEAMACGSPVIVSNRDSLPEITGGAALVIDPLDVRDLARAIELLVCDQALRSQLRAEGLKRAALFSWQKAASQYEEVYAKVLNRA